MRTETDEYGMNGKHAAIGGRYSQAEINGRVLEALSNIEKFNDKLEIRMKEQDKKIRVLEDWKLKAGVYASLLGAGGGVFVTIVLWVLQKVILKF